MKFKLVMIFGFLGLSTLCFGNNNQIEMWTRGPGNYQKGPVKKQNLKNLKLATLKSERRKIRDLQYDKLQEYEGVKLNEILRQYSANNTDLIILHFSNRTLIPLPLKDVESKFGESVFVATKFKIGKAWSSDFPKSKFRHSSLQTPLPVVFNGNKLVVSEGTHPYIDWREHKDFSPWQFVGSLVGIEWAQRDAYERQFSVSQNTKVIDGQMTFLSRCQYCHGVSQVGAQFGWNIDGPLPLYQKRDAGSLFLKVKYPLAKGNYFDTGMPNQRNFTESEAGDLWLWFKEAANKNLLPYTPD